MKPIKLQTPSLDLHMLDSIMEKMEIPEDAIPDVPAKTGVPSKMLRVVFEALFKHPKMVIDKDTANRYTDPRVEAAYLSFKWSLVQNRQALHKAKNRIKKASVEGPFIVGMQVADGTVQFGYRPYKHNTLAKAQAEADKLRDRNNHSYCIFGIVGYSLKVEGNHRLLNTPVEETKKGFKGKSVRSPFKVMEDWKKIILENDISTVNIPVSIGFMANGKYSITFSMSQEVVCFDEYSQCIEFINRWIRDYRNNHPEHSVQEDPEVINVS